MTALFKIGRATTLVLVVLVLTASSRLAQNAAAVTGVRDGSGIHVVDATWLDDRKLDVTLSTDALAMNVHVLVIVPTGYLSQPTTRYPTIYLLNGCNAFGSYSGLEYLGWEAGLHIEANTSSVPAIFVMPEGGAGGFYTNWKNPGSMGRTDWESFHIDQLVPWVDQNFRTIADRSHRGVMGISMGGFGSMSYPARHPDLFGSAAALSGAVDLTNPPDLAEPAASLVVKLCAIADGGDENSTFGSHAEDELNWRAHDPAQLVENLSNTKLYLTTGNGDPGPLDPPGATHDGIEGLAYQATHGFMAALQGAGGTAYLHDYGPGTHTNPYWQREFADLLPKFMDDFAHPQPVNAFHYKTADTTYEQYGWQVAFHRAAQEFSELNVDGHSRFSLTGSGSATVKTAPRFVAGAPYRLTTTTQNGTKTTNVVRADAEGSLVVEVELGPANQVQEFLGDATTTRFTTTVTIAAHNSSESTNHASTLSSPTQPATPVVGRPTFTG